MKNKDIKKLNEKKLVKTSGGFSTQHSKTTYNSNNANNENEKGSDFYNQTESDFVAPLFKSNDHSNKIKNSFKRVNKVSSTGK